MMMMMTTMKKMMMMMMLTSQCVLWGQGARPNFLAAGAATDDCKGKQPDDD